MATILVVDDYPDTCHLLVRLLEQAGHRADCATDAAGALARLRTAMPNLLVLDVMMTDGVGGLELLRRIRDDPELRSVAVVMYSAHDQDTYREQAAALGARDYLLKNEAGMQAVIALADGMAATAPMP
jgi:CheY-like chemotaxis protein